MLPAAASTRLLWGLHGWNYENAIPAGSCMSSQAPQLAPTPSRTDTGDDIDHVSCCTDPDLALCGADVTDASWTLGGGADCVPCHLAVEHGTCPRYGICPSDPLNLS